MTKSVFIKSYVVPLTLKTVNLRRSKEEMVANKIKTEEQFRLCAHELFSSKEKRNLIERYNQLIASFNLECKTRKSSQRSSQNELHTLKELLENKQERIEILADHCWSQTHMLNEAVKILKEVDTSHSQAPFVSSEKVLLLEQYGNELTVQHSLMASLIEDLAMS